MSVKDILSRHMTEKRKPLVDEMSRKSASKMLAFAKSQFAAQSEKAEREKALASVKSIIKKSRG
jgi:hypothetical protein